MVEAITFDELVMFGIFYYKEHGTELNVDNMPWSFLYNGHAITHENNDCYIIPTLEGNMKFKRGDMLITGVMGEIYPCEINIFKKTYQLPSGAAINLLKS